MKFDNEKIVCKTPYKPFSVLIVTTHRLIGKGLAIMWPWQFHGEILLTSISHIEKESWKGKLHKLIIFYKEEGGGERKASIVYYTSYTKYSGFDFEMAYQALEEKIISSEN
ncbi:MAG: hypothetical protein HN390_11415 [Anaerolineae bacterium]|nr:hypothetical protein [Anaerolineae bacterium]